MQLDSYLEIFTTMYGWAFANIIGEVITGTGLVIIPFAIIIFQSWREAKNRVWRVRACWPCWSAR